MGLFSFPSFWCDASFSSVVIPPPPCPAHRRSVCSHPPFTHLHISTSHGCPPPYYSCSCSSDGRLEYIGKLEIGDEAQIRECLFRIAARRPPPTAECIGIIGALLYQRLGAGGDDRGQAEDRQRTGRRQADDRGDTGDTCRRQTLNIENMDSEHHIVSTSEHPVSHIANHAVIPGCDL